MTKYFKSETTKAIVYMIISAFCFSVMSVSVKLAGNDIPIYEKVFFRNFFSIFFAYYILRKSKAKAFGSKAGRPYLLGRAITGVLGVICMFYALERMDVATASTIQKLSQFWVLLFASLFLKEKITKRQIGYLLLALLGVVIVSRPATPSVFLPTLVVFVGSILAGAAYTFVSILRKHEHPSTVVFFFSFFATISMIVPTALNFKVLNLHEFVFLVLTGVSAMGGQVFLTSSYHHAQASEVSIYAYINIIFAAILALLIWGTFPSGLEIMGIAIILIASYLNYNDVRKNALTKGA